MTLEEMAEPIGDVLWFTSWRALQGTLATDECIPYLKVTYWYLEHLGLYEM